MTSEPKLYRVRVEFVTTIEAEDDDAAILEAKNLLPGTCETVDWSAEEV